jgi:hypothetical protein
MTQEPALNHGQKQDQETYCSLSCLNRFPAGILEVSDPFLAKNIASIQYHKTTVGNDTVSRSTREACLGSAINDRAIFLMRVFQGLSYGESGRDES